MLSPDWEIWGPNGGYLAVRRTPMCRCRVAAEPGPHRSTWRLRRHRVERADRHRDQRINRATRVATFRHGLAHPGGSPLAGRHSVGHRCRPRRARAPHRHGARRRPRPRRAPDDRRTDGGPTGHAAPVLAESRAAPAHLDRRLGGPLGVGAECCSVGSIRPDVDVRRPVDRCRTLADPRRSRFVAIGDTRPRRRTQPLRSDHRGHCAVHRRHSATAVAAQPGEHPVCPRPASCVDGPRLEHAPTSWSPSADPPCCVVRRSGARIGRSLGHVVGRFGNGWAAVGCDGSRVRWRSAVMMAAMEQRPAGTWPSPITAASLVGGAVGHR